MENTILFFLVTKISLKKTYPKKYQKSGMWKRNEVGREFSCYIIWTCTFNNFQRGFTYLSVK